MASLTPPPEAMLLARKRDELIPRMSRHRAARLAGMSETRWRQLETGVIRVRGQEYQEIAPAETLARMAVVIGVSPAELREAGRGDGALILEKLLAAPDPLTMLAEDVQKAGGLTDRQKLYLIELIERNRRLREVNIRSPRSNSEVNQLPFPRVALPRSGRATPC